MRTDTTAGRTSRPNTSEPAPPRGSTRKTNPFLQRALLVFGRRSVAALFLPPHPLFFFFSRRPLVFSFFPVLGLVRATARDSRRVVHSGLLCYPTVNPTASSLCGVFVAIVPSQEEASSMSCSRPFISARSFISTLAFLRGHLEMGNQAFLLSKVRHFVIFLLGLCSGRQFEMERRSGEMRRAISTGRATPWSAVAARSHGCSPFAFAQREPLGVATSGNHGPHVTAHAFHIILMTITPRIVVLQRATGCN